jgi:hypothetical protein
MIQRTNMEQEEIKKLDPIKQAYANVLQFITNNFYTQPGEEITIEIDQKSKDNNSYNGKKIVLSGELLDAFGKLNLPRFLVYYHELGHHLYSKGMFNLIDTWQKQTTGPLEWKTNYHHLINWVEDYYIEARLKREHTYLTDVINCIRKMPPEYDLSQIQYAFNYYYVHEAPTPSLVYLDQIVFKKYLDKLLQLRDSNKTRFGYGILTTLSIKKSNETLFAETIIEFYNWCVSKNIFSDERKLPPLRNPNQHLEPGKGQTPKDFLQGIQNMFDNKNHLKDTGAKTSSTGGTTSDHTKQVGKINISGYKEMSHIKESTDMLQDHLVQEKTLIDKEMLDMSVRPETQRHTLDGLFTPNYVESMIIQPRVNVVNFFNPNRIVDQRLFLERGHTYMNVAIYRDISGSTSGHTHLLMSKVTEKLFENIPVDITYYLYASGKVSIVEVPYVKWDDSGEAPKEYTSNPLFEQLGGGTNSDAIADVITQQLSDKWLNIIITDGDLNSLMARDNINALLKNVFAIAVHGTLDKGVNGIEIRDESKVNDITNAMQTLNISGS